jgi:hypothetical protein
MESLSLFKAEESQEETEALSAFGLESIHSPQPTINASNQDVEMRDYPSMGAPTVHAPGHVVPTTLENLPKAQGLQSTIPPRPESTDDQTRVIQRLPQATEVEMKGSAMDPLPQFYKPTTSFVSTSQTRAVSTPIVIPAQEDDDGDGDEEMPTIDMDSDSDEEED